MQLNEIIPKDQQVKKRISVIEEKIRAVTDYPGYNFVISTPNVQREFQKHKFQNRKNDESLENERGEGVEKVSEMKVSENEAGLWATALIVCVCGEAYTRHLASNCRFSFKELLASDERLFKIEAGVNRQLEILKRENLDEEDAILAFERVLEGLEVWDKIVTKNREKLCDDTAQYRNRGFSPYTFEEETDTEPDSSLRHRKRKTKSKKTVSKNDISDGQKSFI